MAIASYLLKTRARIPEWVEVEVIGKKEERLGGREGERLAVMVMVIVTASSTIYLWSIKYQVSERCNCAGLFYYTTFAAD